MCPFCGSGGGVVGIILSIIFFVLLAVIIGLLIWWLVKQMRTGEKETGTDALETLKQRYAKGEITEEEYKRMKKDLS